MNRIRRAAALAACIALMVSNACAGGLETFLKDTAEPSLKERYAGTLEIGVPVAEVLDGEKKDAELAVRQCSLLDCEDRTGGDAMLDRSASKKGRNPEQAKVKTGKAAEALQFALDNGMKVRAGTVVQGPDTPQWFFAEEWSANKAETVDRDLMIQRMKNALRDQITLLNGKYPGLIAEWTVVRLPAAPEEDPFLSVIGEDYVRIALETAAEYRAEGQKLLVSLPGLPGESGLERLRELKEAGLADGVVLSCSLGAEESALQELEAALEAVANLGLEIRLSGLEIESADRTAAGQVRLASAYKTVFALAENPDTPAGRAVQGISFPALRDREDRKEKNTPPRLFNESGHCTVAFFGAMQDEDIPEIGDGEAAAEVISRLDLEAFVKKEEDPVVVYKTAENHNPVMVQRFGADPWAMVYNDRVYLYMTGDEPVTGEGSVPKTNDYSNITTLRVLSSADLVNWEDHGSVRAAGASGAAKWAGNSWAPCAAWKNIDGQDKFFLYFANSGGGIGVLTADSPTGPFTDPLGKPLVSRNTPTCDSVTWLFDPAVLVDEDGSAYLYFGGGIPEGREADPGPARVVRLNDDMISLAGDPEPISPPWLFEDSGINRFGDTYVYSYCSNFNVPSSGSAQGFGSGEIVYLVSDSPTGPFTFGGSVLKNPGVFFGVGGNNHHCMFSFRGEWYITYHAATLDKKLGWNAGYRSTFVDRLALNENGLPAPTKGTYTGVEQLQPLDPFAPVPGATAVTMAGAVTELAYPEDKTARTGRMAVVTTTSGGWTAAAGADFGEAGASSLRAVVRSEVPAKLEILTDSPEGEPAAVLEIPACEGDTEVTGALDAVLTGQHDLYFRFSESGCSLLEWQFNP